MIYNCFDYTSESIIYYWEMSTEICTLRLTTFQNYAARSKQFHFADEWKDHNCIDMEKNFYFTDHSVGVKLLYFGKFGKKENKKPLRWSKIDLIHLDFWDFLKMNFKHPCMRSIIGLYYVSHIITFDSAVSNNSLQKVFLDSTCY